MILIYFLQFCKGVNANAAAKLSHADGMMSVFAARSVSFIWSMTAPWWANLDTAAPRAGGLQRTLKKIK